MSSFIKKVKHPKTGKLTNALFIDGYYAPRVYGVGFRKDGKDASFLDRINSLEFFKEKDV